MKKKIEIVSHGNTWIDPSAPIVCPECASLNIKEDIYSSSEWHGPFFIDYTGKTYSCEDCNCRFKISKDKMSTSIRYCCWDELFGWIFIFALILLLILVVISVIFWDKNNPLPLSMKTVMIVDVIIAIISFLAWGAGSL